MLRSIGSVSFLALLMVGCGGGSGGGTSSAPPPPVTATYSIGGTVTGLTGSGLVLLNNGTDDHAVSAAGAFTFASQLGSGAAYTVTVKTQPSAPVQHCVVTNGSGTVGTANISAVAVDCSSVETYTVRGTVSGLVGSGLTLAICTHVAGPGGGLTSCHDQKQIGADGTFTLASNYPAGEPGRNDHVVIDQQPSSPPQNCLVSDPAVSKTGDTNFTVSCEDYLAYFYVTNAAEDTVSAYSIDATTGVATAIAAPTPTGASPYAIFGFASDDKRYVFVGNERNNSVSAFAVDSTTGALTAVSGSPFAAGTDPQAMAFDGLGNFYVANAGSDNISAYTIDGSTGALTALPWSPGAVGKSPTSIVVDPDGSAVYVANHGGSNDISEFAPGSPLKLISTVPAGGNPLSLALGAGGRFIYSANPDATHPSISGFSVDPGTGALSPLRGSPFPLPVSHYIATDQTGAYLYVTSGDGILGYAIDATTGALTPLPRFPLATGANAYSITIDPTNRILYVANDGAANVSGFTLDASTGALTPMAGSPFPAGSHPDFIATF